MKATIFLFTAALAAAVPPNRLAERIARRSGGAIRSSHPLVPVSAPEGAADFASNETQATEYSGNWAGAVYPNPPSGSFTQVSGYFNVPQASGSSGSSASGWVGIDGDTYGGAILQTGCDFNIQGGNDCWYEWYPDYAYDFSGFNPSPGDTIFAQVIATSNSKGTAKLTNQRTGQSVTKTLSAPSSSATLQGRNAEWIVEAYEENGSQVTLANFGTVKFTSAQAIANGKNVGTSGADIIDMRNSNNKVIATGSIPSNSEVDVKYTG